MRSLGMVMVECHGCAFGVVDKNGKPLKKPFYIVTNDKVLADALRSHRCPGCAEHGSTNGGGPSGETKATGKYTATMAKVIHARGVAPPLPLSAYPTVVDTPLGGGIVETGPLVCLASTRRSHTVIIYQRCLPLAR